MRTPAKAQLQADNKELARALGVREQYISHNLRDEVIFFHAGRTKLGVCAVTSPCGGIVMEAQRDDKGKWYVMTVEYWDAFIQKVRAYPLRHDDIEGQARRACASKAEVHINKVMADFYAPKVAQAMEVQS